MNLLRFWKPRDIRSLYKVFLQDYISKISTEKKHLREKYWLNSEALLSHFNKENIPDNKIEEWKNFKTGFLKKTNWKIPELKNKKVQVDKKIKVTENSLFFVHGRYNSKISKAGNTKGLNVFSTYEYFKLNPSYKEKVYSNPEKYMEDRLSGIGDKKTTALIALNSLLNHGTVIEIEKEAKISNPINIINLSIDETSQLLISPYIIIICKQNSEAIFTEKTYTKNCWINGLSEIYLEKNAKLTYSKFQASIDNSIQTSSLNCSLKNKSNLDLKIFNRENCKEDIRVFLNDEKASAKISGIITSKERKESDVYCKVVHNGKQTFSDQSWRLLSSDSSKTSVNGKIRVNRLAKFSAASFSSKSLILSDKASSFSKPELEILEDDVKCKHGASFGEIDKNLLFYMQSRGIKKQDAIFTLVNAFLSEIGFKKFDIEEIVLKSIKEFFNIGNANE